MVYSVKMSLLDTYQQRWNPISFAPEHFDGNRWVPFDFNESLNIVRRHGTCELKQIYQQENINPEYTNHLIKELNQWMD